MCNKIRLIFLIFFCVLISSLYAQENLEPVASASPTIIVADVEKSADLAQACFDKMVDGAQANLICSYRIASFLISRMPDLENQEKKEENLQIIDALRVSNLQQKQTLEFVRDNATDAKRSEDVSRLLIVAENLIIFSEQTLYAVENENEKGEEAMENGLDRFQESGKILFSKEIK